MVLVIRLIAALAIALSACSAAPVPSPETAPSLPAQSDGQTLDRLRIGGKDLALIARDGCALRIDQSVYRLAIDAPCHFLHRNRSPQAIVHDYGDKGRVVLVVGPPAPAADFAAGSAETPADRCASVARAIIERDGRFVLGEIMRSPAGFCPDMGLDEKFYYGIAHEKPFADREKLR